MSRSCYAALVALAASVLAHGPALAQERTGGSTNPRAAIYGVPAQNKGLYFGWQGAADTDIQFSQFFDADHTLTAWFMPQYNAAYPGALFAENGTRDVSRRPRQLLRRVTSSTWTSTTRASRSS